MATYRSSGAATPFSATGPIERNSDRRAVGGIDDRLADDHLVRPGVVRDPRRDVDRGPVVVALLEDHRAGVEPHVRRRQTGPGHACDHLDRREHALPRVGEVEHDAVAEPLDGPPAVLDRRPAHDPAEPVRQLGGRGVTVLLGELRVAGDVEEAHRRWPVQAAVQPCAGEHRLDPLHEIAGPRLRLLEVVHRDHRLLGEGAHPIAEVGAQDLVRPLAARRRRARAPPPATTPPPSPPCGAGRRPGRGSSGASLPGGSRRRGPSGAT